MLERITEHEVLIDADDAIEAADRVVNGEGDYEASYEWAPQISYTEELDL